MNQGLEALTERERETLRLLLAGHDAKSIARECGLSVHTVNERLREARRKLNVSSSREAARQLGELEHGTPNSFGDKQFGVAGETGDVRTTGQGAGHLLAWLAGGMLVMSLIIATAVFALTLHGSGATRAEDQVPRPVAAAGSAARSTEETSAREWVALVDGRRWEDSWRTAAALFKSQLTAEQWVSAIRPVREPLGGVSSRVLQSATKTGAPPGAPAGEYEILEFRTSFAQRADMTETVVLAREGSGWKVAGYFIR